MLWYEASERSFVSHVEHAAASGSSVSRRPSRCLWFFCHMSNMPPPLVLHCGMHQRYTSGRTVVMNMLTLLRI